MPRILRISSLAVALMLAACGGTDPGGESLESSSQGDAAQVSPPYKPVASVVDLMRGVITLSAEVFWESVSVIVDAEGVHENMPQSDEEWIEVWAAGMAIAESGNLLMMPPRALDQEQWMAYSRDLVDAGSAAAQAAISRDFDGVLAEGETIYNVCVACHRAYVPRLPDL